jgi:hypothetical protein
MVPSEQRHAAMEGTFAIKASADNNSAIHLRTAMPLFALIA